MCQLHREKIGMHRHRIFFVVFCNHIFEKVSIIRFYILLLVYWRDDHVFLYCNYVIVIIGIGKIII